MALLSSRERDEAALTFISVTFNICSWKAHIVHTKWDWKIDRLRLWMCFLLYLSCLVAHVCSRLSVKVVRGLEYISYKEHFMSHTTSCGLIV